jgi:hypothetical protein
MTCTRTCLEMSFVHAVGVLSPVDNDYMTTRSDHES